MKKLFFLIFGLSLTISLLAQSKTSEKEKLTQNEIIAYYLLSEANVTSSSELFGQQIISEIVQKTAAELLELRNIPKVITIPIEFEVSIVLPPLQERDLLDDPKDRYTSVLTALCFDLCYSGKKDSRCYRYCGFPGPISGSVQSRPCKEIWEDLIHTNNPVEKSKYWMEFLNSGCQEEIVYEEQH